MKHCLPICWRFESFGGSMWKEFGFHSRLQLGWWVVSGRNATTLFRKTILPSPRSGLILLHRFNVLCNYFKAKHNSRFTVLKNSSNLKQFLKYFDAFTHSQMSPYLTSRRLLCRWTWKSLFIAVASIWEWLSSASVIGKVSKSFISLFYNLASKKTANGN